MTELSGATSERVVCVNGEAVAGLDRDPSGRLAHTYRSDAPADAFVSLLMPVRRVSYLWPTLHPVYLASLPQGAVRQMLDAALTQSGRAGPYAALDAVRVRLGRVDVRQSTDSPLLEVTPAGQPDPADSRPWFRRLYDAQFTLPVALPAASDRLVEAIGRDALYRLDLGDGAEAYNERCAQSIARRAGFELPASELSADGRLLTTTRFDGLSGARHALEDFCALQGLGPEARYAGSAERLTSIAAALAPPVARTAVRRELFRRIVLSHLLVDTDRHLMTYAVLSESLGDFRLAPLCGLRTAWEQPLDGPAPMPALSIAERRSFLLPAGTLRRFGAHCALSERETRAILTWLENALDTTTEALEREATARTRPWLERLTPYWRFGAASLRAAY